MRKILFICDAFEERGGVEKLVALLVNHYAGDCEVIMILRYGGINARPYFLNPNARLQSYGMCRNVSGLSKLYHFSRYSLWVRSVIRELRPDVICSNGANVSMLSMLFISSQWKSRFVICEHNHFNNVRGIWRMFRSYLYPSARRLISLTKQDLLNYKRMGPSLCIYNPVVLGEISQRTTMKNKKILAVGRHTEQKGFDLLVKAWNIVSETYPDWSLCIVGDGPNKSKLEREILNLGLENSVALLPSTDDIVSQYISANLFVLSSRYEGFCLVMLEAMSVGLPVVAFDCKTGPREVLSYGGGSLAIPEDYGDLAQKILDFIGNEDRWEALSEQARQNASRFSVEAYLKNMDALLLVDGASEHIEI